MSNNEVVMEGQLLRILSLWRGEFPSKRLIVLREDEDLTVFKGGYLVLMDSEKDAKGRYWYSQYRAGGKYSGAVTFRIEKLLHFLSAGIVGEP